MLRGLGERFRIVLAGAEGVKNTEIAERLGVARRTVTQRRRWVDAVGTLVDG